jgi:hypothetical protein
MLSIFWIYFISIIYYSRPKNSVVGHIRKGATNSLLQFGCYKSRRHWWWVRTRTRMSVLNEQRMKERKNVRNVVGKIQCIRIFRNIKSPVSLLHTVVDLSPGYVSLWSLYVYLGSFFAFYACSVQFIAREHEIKCHFHFHFSASFCQAHRSYHIWQRIM